jgi:hypothetical protein
MPACTKQYFMPASTRQRVQRLRILNEHQAAIRTTACVIAVTADEKVTTGYTGGAGSRVTGIPAGSTH